VVTGGDPIPEYLVDGHGGFQCDVAVPEERAAVLWSLLREVVPEVEMDPEDVAAEGFDPRWDEAAVHDDLYDELDLADLAELHDGDDLEAAAVWPSP
jgi:hypothetical protein